MNNIRLLAIAGILVAAGSLYTGWHVEQLDKRVDRLEQVVAIQQKLNRLQDQINTEQDKWDEAATAKLEQETEANQL